MATQAGIVVVGPNPASSQLSVAIKVPGSDTPVQIEILGCNGTHLFLKDYGHQNKGGYHTDINLSFLPAGGLYLVRTTVGNEVYTDKIILIR